MVTVVEIRADDTDDALVMLKGRLRRPVGALRKIGAINEAASLLAFREQALGDIEWPHRYPNQGEPFVNIAGLLSDLNKGGSVKSRRFERRPALIDRGILKQSPASQVIGDKMVETGVSGPAAEYAGKHQHGLVSTIPVPDETKKRLAKFLLGKPKALQRKLSFLVMPRTTSYEVQVAKRPFIGVTDDAAVQIVEAVEEHIAEGDD